MTEFIKVADITDIDLNQSQTVELDGQDILTVSYTHLTLPTKA